MSMVSTPETLMDLIRSSLEGGVPAEDLVEVVRRTDAEVHHREGVSGLSAEGQALPTYYSKPDRLVGIDEAAEMAAVSRGTIGRWLREGRVERAGILHRQFGPGNRNLTLLNRADLERELGRSKDGLLVFQSKRAGHVTIDEAAEVAQVSSGDDRALAQRGQGQACRGSAPAVGFGDPATDVARPEGGGQPVRLLADQGAAPLHRGAAADGDDSRRG